MCFVFISPENEIKKSEVIFAECLLLIPGLRAGAWSGELGRAPPGAGVQPWGWVLRPWHWGIIPCSWSWVHDPWSWICSPTFPELGAHCRSRCRPTPPWNGERRCGELGSHLELGCAQSLIPTQIPVGIAGTAGGTGSVAGDTWQCW